MSALRECPFCKTTKLQLDNFKTVTDRAGNVVVATDWRVMHDEGEKCDAWGPECETREEAIAAWNRRAGDDEVEKLRVRVERLEVLLRQAMDSRAPDLADAEHPGWSDRARAALEDRT